MLASDFINVRAAFCQRNEHGYPCLSGCLLACKSAISRYSTSSTIDIIGFRESPSISHQQNPSTPPRYLTALDVDTAVASHERCFCLEVILQLECLSLFFGRRPTTLHLWLHDLLYLCTCWTFVVGRVLHNNVRRPDDLLLQPIYGY